MGTIKLEQEINEEFVDNFTLTKEELEKYDISVTFDRVLEKLKEFKIARNKFIDGYHVRLTVDYRPRLEQLTQNNIDTVGNIVIDKIGSEQEYNYFNVQLKKLYATMSREENAYINDCLICGKSEASVRYKFGISKEPFKVIKNSATVRFAIAFNLVEYK